MKSKYVIVIGFLIVGLILMYGCDDNQDYKSDFYLDDNHDHDHEHDHEHDHSVEIEGKDMKALTVQQVANLWEINAEELLEAIIIEFNFKKNYTVNTILEEMRLEYKFSPAIIKDLAEEIKNKIE
jgi:hypothetical protein